MLTNNYTTDPVLNSRYLLHEAQQAHYYGLSTDLALASVTSTPATAGGMAHRIGMLQLGADADVVLWDSHPLQLGATPKQVWIDGIQQLEHPVVADKGEKLQEAPKTHLTWRSRCLVLPSAQAFPVHRNLELAVRQAGKGADIVV